MFWSSVESKTLISPPSVTEYGRDHTILVKQNGHWLIKHRVVTSGGDWKQALTAAVDLWFKSQLQNGTRFPSASAWTPFQTCVAKAAQR